MTAFSECVAQQFAAFFGVQDFHSYDGGARIAVVLHAGKNRASIEKLIGGELADLCRKAGINDDDMRFMADAYVPAFAGATADPLYLPGDLTLIVPRHGTTRFLEQLYPSRALFRGTLRAAPGKAVFGRRMAQSAAA